ncbi:hypothetical protein HKX48_000529 [Thoreauomyces humboldtii]|nr:hypothetical protein HKX48_000529 [Thoreauomyces humboldtii]
MAFTSNLKKVELLVDDVLVLSFVKKAAEPRPMSFANNLYSLTSPNNIFTLKTVAVKAIQLDVEVKVDGAKDLQQFSAFMRIATASLAVKAATGLVRDMERTTKKKPPSTTEMHMMCSNFDEYESSAAVREKSSMFDALLPAPSAQGRIFIGFPTQQTTGGSPHLMAHLIPTVERESIDFVDPTLNTWNQELLSMGGLLSRMIFEDDLSEIDRLYSAMGAQNDPAASTWLYKKAAHTMTSFHFKPSTPSTLVSRIIGTYFLSRCSKPLSIMSSLGVRDATYVRLPDENMSGFIKNVPVVPTVIIEQCGDMLKSLEAKGLLRKIGISDVWQELSDRPLTETETVGLMQWWLQYTRTHAFSDNDVQTLLRSAVMTVTSIGNEGAAPVTVRPLSSIQFHAPRHLVPADLPIPDSCLPQTVSHHFKKEDLEGHLRFPWSELPLSIWAEYVVHEEAFSSDSGFVERVLAVLSRHVGSMRLKTRQDVISLLKSVKCIPTAQGLFKPDDSYFSKVTLFPDLPIVHLANQKAVSESFLKLLGVREHVELQLVFSRIKTLNWDHMQLIKYLGTCTLKPEETERLRVTAIFPKEPAPGVAPSRERFRADSLYSPDPKLKFRDLGLPVMRWEGKWRPTANEAEVLKRLGLRDFIPIDELIALAAAGSPAVRKDVLSVFVERYKTIYAALYRPREINTPFLPTTAGPLAVPSGCCADPAAAVMGFAILHPDWTAEKDKFGVRDHPTPSALIERLLEVPPDNAAAPATFSYMQTRSAEFSGAHWALLGTKKFVPTEGQPTTWMDPRSVYFGTATESLYGMHFTYVDFGVSANPFLRACGTREEPTPAELTRSMVATPETYLESLGHEKYLDMLRTVATNFAQLKGDSTLLRDMQAKAWLIGVGASNQSGDETREGVHYVKLARADEIFLIDDITVNQLFAPLGAPPDELLEQFYEQLGSKWLATMVRTEELPRGNQIVTAESKALQKLIRERALLLLYDGQAIRSGKDVVRSNAETLLEKLNVVQVSEIQVVRKFQQRTSTQLTTACIRFDSRTRSNWLFVVKDFDTFDIARAIGQVVLRNCRLKDSLLLSTLLSTSLENLRRKGFPVDRILRLSDNKIRNAQVHAEKQLPPPGSNDTLANAPLVPSKSPVGSLSDLAMLRQLFPDADQQHLQRELAEASSQGQGVDDVAAKMLDAPYPKRRESDKQLAPITPSSGSPISANDGVLGLFGKAKDRIARDGLGGLMNLAQETLSGSSSPTFNPANAGPANLSTHSTEALRNHLEKSVSTLRGTRESAFKATIATDQPPSAPPAPTPYTSQCNAPAASDLVLSATVAGIPVYTDRAVTAQDTQEMLETHRMDVAGFVNMHLALANVFGASMQTIHIYWDRDGGTIAFNRGRTLFFNLRFYISLHASMRKQARQSQTQPLALPGAWNQPAREQAVSPGTDHPDTYYYWFFTWCHELAHNFVGEHDSAHEYWMSSFAELYMGKLVRTLRRAGIEE